MPAPFGCVAMRRCAGLGFRGERITGAGQASSKQSRSGWSAGGAVVAWPVPVVLSAAALPLYERCYEERREEERKVKGMREIMKSGGEKRRGGEGMRDDGMRESVNSRQTGSPWQWPVRLPRRRGCRRRRRCAPSALQTDRVASARCGD